MGKKTFKGRPLIPGNLEGKALASKHPFNVTGSYMENLFGGKTDGAPCTDANNEEFHGKDLAGAILCFPTAVGSTMGGVTLMGVGYLGQGPRAMLYAEHADSVSLAGLLMDDIWNDRRIITIDQLGGEFIEAVKTGDPIAIHEDGTVEVG
jgi:predicted aconitase with swiveling domain